MKNISLFLCAIAINLVLVSSVNAASATPDQNLTLSPVKQKLELKAGQTYKGSFHLLNGGKSNYGLKVYSAPYSVKDENYTADFESKKANTDLEGWIKFAKTNYYLESNKSIDVDYTIRIPENARPGGHYAVLFAETLPKEGTSDFGVSSTQRLGMLAYVTVEGRYESGGNVKNYDVPFFQLKSPLATTTRVENTGNVDFNVIHKTEIYNIFGKKRHSAQKDYAVLPGTVRALKQNWDGGSSFGLYRVEVHDQFLNTDTGKSFWVLMAPVWLYLLVPLVALVSIVFYVQRRR